MKKFIEWLKIRETGAGAGVPFVGQKPGEGSWQGAVDGGKLSSVGDVKIKKTHKKKHHKKKK